MPVKGSYTTSGNEGEGGLVFRASYMDKGSKEVPPLSSVVVVLLRNPTISVSEADEMKDVILNHHIGSSANITPKKVNSYLRFNKIDLTGIKHIEFIATDLPDVIELSNLNIEVRKNSSSGELIGQSSKIFSSNNGKNVNIVANIDSMKGKHDVYFVFANSNKIEEDYFAQLQIKQVRFIAE